MTPAIWPADLASDLRATLLRLRNAREAEDLVEMMAAERRLNWLLDTKIRKYLSTADVGNGR